MSNCIVVDESFEFSVAKEELLGRFVYPTCIVCSLFVCVAAVHLLFTINLLMNVVEFFFASKSNCMLSALLKLARTDLFVYGNI